MSSLLASSPAPPMSWNLATDLRQLLAYHFMVNAFRAGAVVAITAGVIGWYMVLRQESFAGHTLAVVGFPGASGAAWLGWSTPAGYFGFCIAAAVVLARFTGRSRDGAFSEGSAVIGTLQAFALACGFLFVTFSHGFLNGIDALLFGSFLGVSDLQVVVLAGVAVAVVATLAVIGRPLLFATVDPDVAAARGLPVGRLSTIFLLLLGVAAAEVSQITGSLLVFALLVMPAATAQRLTPRPVRSLTLAVVIAVAVTWGGLVAAYFSSVPVGFSITSLAFAAYLGALIGRRS